MNEEFKAVFDMENVPEVFKPEYRDLFVHAYNDYCEISNEMLHKANELWDRYLKDFEVKDAGEKYDTFIAGALDSVAKAMNERYNLNKIFEFFIDRPDLNFAVHIKNIPESKISFHLEKM